MGMHDEDNLGRLIAESDIRQVVLRMMRAIDRLDPELAATCYHEGARGEFLGFQGTLGDYLDWMWGTLQSRFSDSMHFAGNILVDFPEADPAPRVAVAETYVVSFHSSADPENAPQNSFVFGGRYVDRFEKRPTDRNPAGAWGIVERIVVHDWKTNTDPTLVSVPKPGAVVGKRDREDPIYAMLSVLGQPATAGS